jgi:hypothetical protein
VTAALGWNYDPRVALVQLYGDPIAAVTVTVRTVSELNDHSHWRARQKRAKEQRSLVTLILQAESRADTYFGYPPGPFPFHVHMTRLASRKLDTDNLAGALKAIRDGVAQYLGVDDGDERLVTWSVGQEQQKGYNVRIEFYRRQP